MLCKPKKYVRLQNTNISIKLTPPQKWKYTATDNGYELTRGNVSVTLSKEAFLKFFKVV